MKKLKLIIAASFLTIALLLILLYEMTVGFGYAEIPSLDLETASFNKYRVDNSLTEIQECITFSHNEHFFEDTILVSLNAVSDDVVAIYYSLDGSPPDTDKGILYKNELKLSSGKRGSVNSYTVKAVGQKEDGTFTSVKTHSYFIGSNVFERFDTLIFALSTDPFNLYDKEFGIAVPGILREEYIKETGDRDPDPPAPANYNLRGREAERPMFVELISPDGQSILKQNAGVRVHGGWSRSFDQKSFRLYARRYYDEIFNNFYYDFFPDDFTHYGRPITHYDRVILRNNGNDNHFGFIRDEVVSQLASTLLPDTQSSRAAAVYLNGQYYGFAWMKQYYNRGYLNQKNEIRNGDWVILKGSARAKDFDEEDSLETKAAEEYQAFYDLYPYIQDDDVFAELSQGFDIDNMLAYYAVQVYSNNWDWPWGNYKVYRYYGEEGTYVYDGISKADGKWRWLLFDSDWTFGLYDSYVEDNSLARILGIEITDRDYSPLFLALMNREDTRTRFVEIMCDIMNYHFEPNKVEKTVRLKEAERMNELQYNYRDGGALKLNASWSNLGFVKGQIDKIIDFGYRRPNVMKKHLEKYLDISPSGFYVTVSMHEKADIKLGTIDITDDFQGFYYDICTLTLSASKLDGYAFSHWLVNGEVRTDEVLKLGKEDVVYGNIDIELVLLP